MVGFPVQQQTQQQKTKKVPVAAPSPIPAPAAAPAAADGQAVLANKGRAVQQQPINYAGRIAGQFGGNRFPRPVAAPAVRPMPAETQNRAFRAQNAGSGNFMRTPRAPSPTPVAAPGLRPKEYVGTWNGTPAVTNPVNSFQGNTLGTGAASASTMANVAGFGGAAPKKPLITEQLSPTGRPNANAGVSANWITDAADAGADFVNQWSQQASDDQSGGSTSTYSGSEAQDQQNMTPLTPEERQAALNDGLNPDDPEIIRMFHNQSQANGGGGGTAGYTDTSGGGYNGGRANDSGFDPMESIRKLIDQAQGGGGGGGGFGDNLVGMASDVATGIAGGLVEPAAAAADRINGRNKKSLADWFGDYGLQGNKDYAASLLDPNVQAAAEKAGAEQLRSDVDYNTDRNLRMQMSQAAGGGRMGGGSTQAAFDSANKATADGQRQLIKDAFQRKLQAGQLGTQINSDAARQINAILNDQYTSPNDIMAIMAQVAPEVFGDITQLIGQMAESGKNPFLSF